MASQSHRIWVADLSSSRHLSQVGSSVNPSLKRCPFKWQCPVKSPTTHLNWSRFNFNRSFVLLAEGPSISHFACRIGLLKQRSVLDCFALCHTVFWTPLGNLAYRNPFGAILQETNTNLFHDAAGMRWIRNQHLSVGSVACMSTPTGRREGDGGRS
jgi:hypothetical protein